MIITMCMSPSNLARVTVGICNEPRGRHMLCIKCQWLSNKSLSGLRPSFKGSKSHRGSTQEKESSRDHSRDPYLHGREGEGKERELAI